MKKYIRGKNFVGNYEIRKAIENDPMQPVRKCSSNIAKMNIFEYVYYFFKDWEAFAILIFPAYMLKLNVIMTKPDVTQHIFQILR